MKIITLSLLLLQSLAVHSQSNPNSNPASTDWKTLDESGYSIQYPQNWELDKSGKVGTSFIIFSALTTPQDQFKENVNLLVQDLTGYNLDLDKYAKLSEDQIKTMITNGNLIESKKLRANGVEFHKMVYTGDQGILNLKFEQYFWVKDNKAYVLSFTAEAKEYDAYKGTGEKILNSFLFK